MNITSRTVHRVSASLTVLTSQHGMSTGKEKMSSSVAGILLDRRYITTLIRYKNFSWLKLIVINLFEIHLAFDLLNSIDTRWVRFGLSVCVLLSVNFIFYLGSSHYIVWLTSSDTGILCLVGGKKIKIYILTLVRGENKKKVGK